MAGACSSFLLLGSYSAKSLGQDWCIGTGPDLVLAAGRESAVRATYGVHVIDYE